MHFLLKINYKTLQSIILHSDVVLLSILDCTVNSKKMKAEVDAVFQIQNANQKPGPILCVGMPKTSNWGEFNMELTSKEHKDKHLLFFMKSFKYLLTCWN